MASFSSGVTCIDTAPGGRACGAPPSPDVAGSFSMSMKACWLEEINCVCVCVGVISS